MSLRTDGSVLTYTARYGLTLIPPDLASARRFSEQGGDALYAVQSDGKVVCLNRASMTEPAPCAKRFHPDGSLDSSFNAPTNYFRELDNIGAIAVQPDGKVVIGGSLPDQKFWTAKGYDGPMRNLFRLNADGSDDPSLTFQGLRISTVQRIIALPNGQLLIGGSIETFPERREGVVRLNNNGAVDYTFLAEVLPPIEMKLLPDGKILLGAPLYGRGESMLRLRADGTIDPTFDTRTANEVERIFIQSDGRIVTGGHGNPVRYYADGGRDTSFVPRLQTGRYHPNSYGIAVDHSDRVIVHDDDYVVRYSGRLRVTSEPDPATRILERSDLVDRNWFPVQTIPANTPLDYAQPNYPSPINAFYRARPVQ